MPEPKVLVLRAAGINCDHETAFAFEKAGASVRTLHVNRVLEAPSELDRVGLVAIPGGFSYGDDIAAGKVLAVELAHALGDRLRAFLARGGLVLGICNGFQVLIKTGLIRVKDRPAEAVDVTLHWNDSHRYEDRWVHVAIDPALCVLAPRDRRRIALPVAHGEGRIVLREPGIAETLRNAHQIVFRYVTKDGGDAAYPENPNGSDAGIAGLCDPSGQVLGLMPHPERAMFPWHHPAWTREPPRSEGDGFSLFRAAVAALR